MYSTKIQYWVVYQADGCPDATFEDGCSRKNVYSAFIFIIHALVLLASNIYIVLLLVSFRIEVKQSKLIFLGFNTF